jgi:outer membrane lipoprotein carrier protein
MARLIMNSVAGKSLTDNTAFEVSAEALPTEYVATLLPLRKEMKRMYAKLVLHFDIKQSTVNKVELHEKNGNRTVIELHDIQTNK